MTVSNTVEEKRGFRLTLPIAFCAALALIFYAEGVRSAFTGGVRLAVCSVLPSVFPFMIIADYIRSGQMPEGGPLSRLFGRAFGLPSGALGIYLTGVLCGFPVGVRSAAEAYRSGTISGEECERLSAIASSPSPAFVISGVGLMLGDIGLGSALYICVILSSLLVGAIFARKSGKIEKPSYNSRQRFDLVASVKNAGYASVAISSYIIFFSILLSALKTVIRSDSLIAVLSCLLEVGNAAATLSGDSGIPPAPRLSLIAFSLAFSGLSVHMQSFSFLPEEISRRRIILLKLFQGLVAFSLCLLYCIMIKK